MLGGVRGAADLDARLAPFLEVMGRKTRRTWAPLYLRGLLGPGERKSLQPMAARLGLSGQDQPQHFIASPTWDDAPLWTVLAHEADRLVGGPDAYLVIDDTALPKKARPAKLAGVKRCWRVPLLSSGGAGWRGCWRGRSPHGSGCWFRSGRTARAVAGTCDCATRTAEPW